MPIDLAGRINAYLMTGGTHNEGIGLGNELKAAYEAQRAAKSVISTPPSAVEPDAPAK